ncbi:type IV secretion system DNA-binding domain-containing protein [Patescibacteria group bacterium]|nr:type IV secretion system DNA-binding domain-containing protein [Patescibacteria group bacterium]
MDEVPAEELTVLAKTNFRGEDEKFGIKLKDRARHVYVIGKSGTGKSTLLENMLIDDIRERRGAAVIDPHGDLVDTVLEYVPSYRANDVIVFDVGDRDFPIAVNMFEITDPKYKVVVASGVVGIFKKIFGYSWGPRLEYWLSSAILALLDYPEPTLMMVPKIFTDKAFREKVVAKVQDPLIKDRWMNEYSKLDQRQQAETISPILNKVGQFLSSPIIRNIVGQPKSAIYFRKLMDEGKILLVKLSKGLIGEDNAALLGSMIITQIQLAAMSRADVPESERPDFYLYVDEFQNFATDSFQMILSEARKYHLSLTLANQYMAQLSPEIGSAIRGNVNTMIAFRVGPEDAGPLETEFAPVFTATDLVNLNMFNIYLKISIDNLTTDAFSAQTLPLPTDKNNIQDKITAISREQYAKPVSFVEGKIISNFGPAIQQQPESKRYPDNRGYQGNKNYDNRNRSYNNQSSSNRSYDNRSNRTDNRQSQARPVPFRPGVKVSSSDNRPVNESTASKKENNKTTTPIVDKTVSQPSKAPIERKKPIESLLKKVISSIESKKPWQPGDKSSKSTNLISKLKGDNTGLEDIRRQKSEEIDNNQDL